MIYIYITNEDIADLKPDHVDVLLVDFAKQFQLWIFLDRPWGSGKNHETRSIAILVLGCNTKI
jgi:hypothetical protein